MSPVHLVVVVLLVISPILGKPTISISPTGMVYWQTSVTLTCGDTNNALESDAYDVLSGQYSLFESSSPYSFTTNDRVTLEQIDGGIKVIISDLTNADNGTTFKCSALRQGLSESITLSVLEPPAVPANLAVVPSYTDAQITFDSSVGANYYTVECQAVGEVNFNMVAAHLTVTTLALPNLSVATKYTVRLTSFNDAGARGTATKTFKTLDNRTPLVAESVKLDRNWTHGYTKVAIIISWETANSAASSIPITKAKITMAENGKIKIVEKDGAIKSHTFESMSPDTKYEFTIALVNDNGEGPAANDVMEVPAPTVKPIKKTEPPTPPKQVPTEPVKLSCDSATRGYTIGQNGTFNIEVGNYGDDVYLACSAQNGNGSEIEWKLEGAPYPGENKPQAIIDGTKSTIKFTANEVTQGLYECNIAGEDNKCSYTVISPDIGATRGAARSMTSYLCLMTALIIVYLH